MHVKDCLRIKFTQQNQSCFQTSICQLKKSTAVFASHNSDFYLIAEFYMDKKKKEEKTLWPLFMDGVQLPQG